MFPSLHLDEPATTEPILLFDECSAALICIAFHQTDAGLRKSHRLRNSTLAREKRTSPYLPQTRDRWWKNFSFRLFSGDALLEEQALCRALTGVFSFRHRVFLRAGRKEISEISQAKGGKIPSLHPQASLNIVRK